MTPAAVAYLLQALQLAPQLMGVVSSISQMMATGREPTEADQAELDKLRDALHKAAQA